jgi:hypothetical protein
MVRERGLGLHFPFDVSLSPFSMFPEFRKRKTELILNGNVHCLLQTENGNGKLPVVCWKRKTEACFPFSANDKRQSMIAVSASVQI